MDQFSKQKLDDLFLKKEEYKNDPTKFAWAILKEEDGSPLEIDGKLLMDILHDTYAMALAAAIDFYSVDHSQHNLARRVNKLLVATWGNKLWCQNYVRHLFQFVRTKKGKK